MIAKIWHKIWNALNYIWGWLQWGSRYRLRRLKNVHKGKRCFVIGNGPSLCNADLLRLNKCGEYTLACNSLIKLFNEIPFYPTYYFAQDNKIILDNINEIKEFMLSKGFSNYETENEIRLIKEIGNDIAFFETVYGNDKKAWMYVTK